jgi:hypothetical protein
LSSRAALATGVLLRWFIQLTAFQSERRPYQYADPLKSCVPLLVTT